MGRHQKDTSSSEYQSLFCSADKLTLCHLLNIMKVSTTALAVLLCTMTLCNQVFSAPYGADTPTACCFSYSRKIPRQFIVDYFETSSLCSQPGVIFLTKRNRQICADSKETWVQEYITDLELNA